MLPFLGFFFGMAYQKQIDSLPQESVPVEYANPSPTPTPTKANEFRVKPTESVKSDWKTYNNFTLGISLKYPRNWRLEPKEEDQDMISLYFFSGDPIIGVDTIQTEMGDLGIINIVREAYTGNVTLQEWINQQLELYKATDPTEVVLDSCNVVPSALECGKINYDKLIGYFPGSRYYLRTKNYVYMLNDPQNLATFYISDNLISTITFLKN